MTKRETCADDIVAFSEYLKELREKIRKDTKRYFEETRRIDKEKVMNNCTKDIVAKGQNIIRILEKLKKRIDARAKTSLLNFFLPNDIPGDFSLLDVLVLLIGTPRTATDIRTLKIDEELKKEINQWLQMVFSTTPEAKQDLKLSYIQTFLHEKTVLSDSISNKSDKCKSELIQNVMKELEWNIGFIQRCYSATL